MNKGELAIVPRETGGGSTMVSNLVCEIASLAAKGQLLLQEAHPPA